jgi:Fe-S oxidoreductase
VTFHDPCRLGRHLDTYDAPRNLLETIPGIEIVEMAHSRVSATCCGGTCWMECGAAVKSLQAQRLSEAARTGASTLVTACPKCDIHFGCAVAGSEYDGPAISNIVDLMASALGVDEPEQTAAVEEGEGRSA